MGGLSNASRAVEQWSRIESAVARAEYDVAPCPGGFAAPNRAQGIRATFHPGGVEIVPRIGTSAACWRWVTVAWGRTGSPRGLREALPVTPEAAGPVVSYERDGLVEWYENSPRGLEQGFTLPARPGGQGALSILGRIEGDHSLSYGELFAVDATGVPLPATMSRSGSDVSIEVDDEGAVYPVTIDPLITTPAWFADSDDAGAQLGFAVSTAGDVNADGFSDLLVGAPGFDNGAGTSLGKIFLYLGGAAGPSAAPQWVATLGALGGLGELGESVGPAGDVNGDGYDDVIAGAPEYTDDALASEGHVFVWYGGPSGGGGGATGLGPNGTAANADWEAESEEANALFGRSAVTAGDVNGDGYDDVIIGAPGFDGDEGEAFVWLGGAGGLGSDGLPGNADWRTNWPTSDAAGWSVATAGDVNADGYADVLVGVPLGTNGQAGEGGAFLWLGSAAGLGAEGTPFNADWRAEGNQALAELGRSVSCAGDLNGDGYSDVVIGAPRYDNGSADEGAAFVWLGSDADLGANGFPGNAAWTREGTAANVHLGSSVATAGDVDGDGFADVLIGCPECAGGEGSAFVFRGRAAGPESAAIWSDTGGQANAHFGNAVATAGDVNGDGFGDVVVGAWLYDGGEADEGGAFAYHGSGNGPEPSAAWSNASDQAGADFGVSVASAGDVNGDGYSDFLVAAPRFDAGHVDEGKIFLYAGRAIDPSFVPIWTAEGNQTGAQLGARVASAGDVNGDGYSDILAGAPGYDAGLADEGAAFVWFGETSLSGTGSPSTADWRAEGDQENAALGTCVASAGDVNGDGFCDVAVGAPFYDGGESNEGAVFVYLGSPSGPSPVADWAEERNQASAQFGHAVASAGDVNGDGFGDLIAGAPNYDGSHVNEGRAWVFHGSMNGLAASAAWFADVDEAGAGLGSAIACAGDVDADGFSDVLVSAPSHTNGQTNEGQVFLHRGSAAGLLAVPSWVVEGNAAFALLGYSVSSAGDVNGDGRSDVVIGAPGMSALAGQIHVYLSAAAGLPITPSWTKTGGSAGDQLGIAVACAGDVTGDGFADILAGADGFTDPEADEGGAFLHYGNAINGLERVPRQVRVADEGPIDLLGASDMPSSFGVRLLGRTALGRGLVRLEWEVEPVGAPFDGDGIESGSLSDTGMPGTSGSVAMLAALVTGLDTESPVHWRARTVSRSPYFPRSPWFSPPGNARTETDLRTGAEPLAIGDPEEAPGAGPRVLRALPNPFRATSAIHYEIAAKEHVRLVIYDVQGRAVRTLVDRIELPGRHVERWDGRNEFDAEVSPGIYLARLSTGDRAHVEKIVLER